MGSATRHICPIKQSKIKSVVSVDTQIIMAVLENESIEDIEDLEDIQESQKVDVQVEKQVVKNKTVKKTTGAKDTSKGK